MSNLLPAERVPCSLRRQGGRGRSSELFPDLNFAATAEAVPCAQSHLSNVLHGERIGGVPMLQRIATVLCLSLTDLLEIQAKATQLRAEHRAECSEDIEAIAV